LATTTHPIIEGPYLRDVLDQPTALAATLRELRISGELTALAERLRGGRIQRIVLTGMGASYYALHPLFLQLNACGHTALHIETSELVHNMQRWFEPGTLIVVVSQSGRSAEVVRLLEDNRGRAAIIGVTNFTDSPLALQANAALVTTAGTEFSVSCKTYVTALMALQWLGDFLSQRDAGRTREEMEQAVPAVASYLSAWKSHVSQMPAELAGSRNLFLLGRGASLAASGAGALIIKESVRLHAEGMSGAAYRHGPLEMANTETFVVIFAGAENTRTLQASLRDDLQHAGCRTAWIAEDSAADAWKLPSAASSTRPILEILPVQMMTLALAGGLGIEAGRLARVSKVTTTE